MTDLHDGVTSNKHKARSDLSTRRLLEAAGELVVEGGYAAMTLAAVGERAGYSRGIVTARFGSKEGLLNALVKRIVAGFNHRNVLPRTEGRPGCEAVTLLLDAIATQAASDASAIRVLYALMFEALGPIPDLHATIALLHDAMRADLAKLIRAGLRDGSVRKGVSPVDEAAFIVAGLRGIGYQWLLQPEEFDATRAFRHLAGATKHRLAQP
jgi:AcrR family transcriptional regulator